MNVTINKIKKVENDGIIPNKKPDVIIRHNEKGICVLSTSKFN
jgi:hypothetical protein